MVVSENGKEVVSDLSDDYVLMDVSSIVAESNDTATSINTTVVKKLEVEEKAQ